ncbi:MAG: cytochrome C [Betaproteobacteria bacterium]|nr:cytochrome C [Betaproteobacteria bacterium]
MALGALLAAASSPAHAAGPSAALVEHGRYIVHDVGMCGDCHSPRDEHGNFIQARWLRGGPIGFEATHLMPAWAGDAVDLVTLAKEWSEADLVAFLRTGATPRGTPPARPPMPRYRMSARDARAVAAYLRSLGK